MNHQQILEKLAAKHLVQSIDEDLKRLAFEAMCYEKHGTIASQSVYVIPKLLLRWNCVLAADHAEVTPIYQEKTVLALAVLLHKYGLVERNITQKALQAIDILNKEVILSDDFACKSDEIKQLLLSAPSPLNRKPSISENITFYRAQDVIAMQLENKYYAAYVHGLTGPNESPIVEFYDGVFDCIPNLEQLKGTKAIGATYNDGKQHISLYGVCGMKYLPDLANQVHLIGACVLEKPANEYLEDPVGLYTVTDLFGIQEIIKQLFAGR